MKTLNGKKTAIGTVLLALGAWLPSLGVGGEWVELLTIIGTLLGGVGIVHKQMKGEFSAKGN